MPEAETATASGADPGAASRPADVLRKPVPGKIYPWVRRASWIELAVFAVLLIVWAIPGMEQATFYAGLAHGLGYVALVIVIWIAIMRREAPYTLLAATLTPVGPVGSVIAIEWLDRRSGGHDAPGR